MAKRRKGASHTGEGHYQRTQFTLLLSHNYKVSRFFAINHQKKQ